MWQKSRQMSLNSSRLTLRLWLETQRWDEAPARHGRLEDVNDPSVWGSFGLFLRRSNRNQVVWKHNEGREEMFLISSGETDAPPATRIKICHSSFQKQRQSFLLLLRPLIQLFLFFICVIAVSDDWQRGASQGFSVTTGAVWGGEQVETLIFSVMSSKWNKNRQQKETESSVETAQRGSTMEWMYLTVLNNHYLSVIVLRSHVWSGTLW